MVNESNKPENGQLGLSSELLAMLVCPADHGKLEVREASLVCTVCGATYEVSDGIPSMVITRN